MTTYEEALWLEVLLDLPRRPVGIHFLMTKEDYDAFPAEAPQNRMSYCTMVRKASQGIAQKAHLGHMACIGGATALGLVEPTEEMKDGTRRYKQWA